MLLLGEYSSRQYNNWLNINYFTLKETKRNKLFIWIIIGEGQNASVTKAKNNNEINQKIIQYKNIHNNQNLTLQIMMS